MLTEADITLKQKLNFETARISWKEIETFFAKGVLLQIEAGEDLVNTADLIASNNVKEIENLILNKKIAFATPEWVKKNCLPNTELWTVVVAPYVVCQLA